MTAALRFRLRPVLILLVVVCAVPETAGAVCSTSCILVNDASDTIHPGCDFGGLGTCSLRDAITRSNAIQGWSMQFAVGSGHQRIDVLSDLPSIITRGTIDGTTQPGYAGAPLIEVHRSDAGHANNAIQVTADGLVTVRGLIINHFPNYAISFVSPGSNFVENCYIGTDATGTVAEGNLIGIYVFTGVAGNTIGGLTPDKRNVISGNDTGILIQGTNDNQVIGNYIGTDAGGTLPLPNTAGVQIFTGPAGNPSTGNIIGGDTAAARNVIAGNPAIAATGVTLEAGVNNAVRGNYIGLDVTGTVSLPVEIGISYDGEAKSPIANNVISATIYGIITSAGPGGYGYTHDLAIQGNLIGTDISGKRLLVPGGVGITLGRTQNVLIGGSSAGQGNVIGGFGHGIDVASSFNTILGNFIGVAPDGTPIPNTNAGVLVNASDTVVGGDGVGQQNYIAYNGQGTFPRQIAPGVWVAGGTGSVIRGNSMFLNTGKGIDFYPSASLLPYPNDVGDLDSGPPNNLQNWPLITNVTLGLHTIRVQGTLNSKPNTQYGIDVYADRPPRHPADLLQGQNYLGLTEPITDALGNATFDVTFTVPENVPPDLWITATASTPGGIPGADTSELSQRGLFLVTPNHGPASGGTGTTLQGQLFQPGAIVRFGSTVASSSYVNATTMNATTPALAPGTLYDVSVTNPDGTKAVMRKAFVTDFNDVPTTSPYYPFIVAIAGDGVTAGCGGGNFCPFNLVTRAQMAVFLLVSKYGPWYIPPPATGTVFLDVPLGSFAAAWIEELAHEGVTAGCGGGNYCPSLAVTRGQMAVFLLRTRHGSSYLPPPATGTVFADVSTTTPFAAWIERLYREGITAGCAAAPLRYCPTDDVIRIQMAVFLVRAFAIPL